MKGFIKMKDKKCYIVGAGDNSGTNFNKGTNEYVIAADGGVKVLEELNIIPDIILGDFDSLGYVPKGDNVLLYKVEKDDTDMMLAVEKAVESGYNNIEIFGGTGGRIDHTIANFQTMLWASRKGCKIKMLDAQYEYYVITDEELILGKKDTEDLSVFALGSEAKGVTIQGAKYVTNNIELTPDNPMAVSNSFIGNDVSISVKKGSLLIIAQK